MTKPFSQCSLPDLAHEISLVASAASARALDAATAERLLPCLRDPALTAAVLLRNPHVRDLNGLQCTSAAGSKQAWCSMLRDLFHTAGVTVSSAAQLRIYLVCKDCCKRGRVRLPPASSAPAPPSPAPIHAAAPPAQLSPTQRFAHAVAAGRAVVISRKFAQRLLRRAMHWQPQPLPHLPAMRLMYAPHAHPSDACECVTAADVHRVGCSDATHIAVRYIATGARLAQLDDRVLFHRFAQCAIDRVTTGRLKKVGACIKVRPPASPQSPALWPARPIAHVSQPRTCHAASHSQNTAPPNPDPPSFKLLRCACERLRLN